MSKFMFLFRGGQPHMLNLSPEQVQAHMAKWGAYMGALSAQGKLHGGSPLKPEGTVLSKMGGVLTDGPFTEGKEIVGGYLMIEAADLDEALEISKGCPILDFDGNTIEVREIAEIER